MTVSVTQFGPVGEPVEIAPGVSDTFYGRGRMTVANAGSEPLTLYMPIGTLITSVNPEEQDLVAYATSIEAADEPVASTEGGPGAQAATQAPAQAPTQAATQAPTQAATQAPTQAATQAPTQAASPVASQPQAQQARSFLEPVNPAAAQLPNTSGGGLPILAIALGALGLGAHAVRRALRRRD